MRDQISGRIHVGEFAWISHRNEVVSNMEMERYFHCFFFSHILRIWIEFDINCGVKWLQIGLFYSYWKRRIFAGSYRIFFYHGTLYTPLSHPAPHSLHVGKLSKPI